ncbi:DUF4321 domain-containing protein [Brevibacillus dissolubilis]|uniref:DUF4321 domain-containing protein n=1 Tax=Brevibacillus dissolubilis TaxID=1844116 RepID=UPI0011173AE4|nr:DUF4321 domain-containing protein [Brevibacillus dissolubilis]
MTGREILILVAILITGALFGSILGTILSPWMPFLGISKTVSWNPSADLDILKYDLHFQVKLNLASIGGLALAVWIHRKIR